MLFCQRSPHKLPYPSVYFWGLGGRRVGDSRIGGVLVFEIFTIEKGRKKKLEFTQIISKL